MPKKSFSTAGMDLLGLRPKDNTEPKIDAPVEIAEKVKPEVIKELPIKTEAIPASTKKQTSVQPQAQKLVRKSYYVTPAQHKALKIKAATGDTAADKDISTIIRSAIDMYLAKK